MRLYFLRAKVRNFHERSKQKDKKKKKVLTTKRVISTHVNLIS